MVEYVPRDEMIPEAEQTLYDAVPKSEEDARELQRLTQLEIGSDYAGSDGERGGPAPAARDMPHYVPKEDIKPPQTIYEPDMSQGSEGITQVQSLSELATASSAAAAHEVAPCAVIKGIRGFASFVNGTYRRVENYLHEDRYVYQLSSPVPLGQGSAAGKHLYIYFKGKQSAWAVGMRVGSSGVLAYRRTTGKEPFQGDKPWKVSDTEGRFHQEDDVSITPAGGFTVPRSTIAELKELSRPYGVLPYGTTRNEAEARLKQLRSQNGMPGCFVIRQSTSMNGSYILSVAGEKDIVHVRLDSANDRFFLPGTSHSAATLDALITVIRHLDIQLASGEQLPQLTEQVLP